MKTTLEDYCEAGEGCMTGQGDYMAEYGKQERGEKWSRYADSYNNKLSRNGLSAGQFDAISCRLEKILGYLGKYDKGKTEGMTDALSRLYLNKAITYVTGIHKGTIQEDPAAEKTFERAAEFLRKRPLYREQAGVLEEWLGYSKEFSRKQGHNDILKEKVKNPRKLDFRSNFRQLMQNMSL